DHAGAIAIHSPDLDDDQAGANSDGGDDDEFIPETQPPNAEQAMGLPTIAAPLRRVFEEAGHYSTINEEGMHSGSADDRPSSYPISGEAGMEIGLKPSNDGIHQGVRATQMAATTR
ncbi:hypothetical protein PIB30_094735, partial [Stylosanthes scabra]|nr:hypothetical protein [Stylosanthes scabra]